MKRQQDMKRQRGKKAAKIILCLLLLAFLGSAIWDYADFRLHPMNHVMDSAPWYVSSIVRGMIMSPVALVCVVVLL